MKKILIKIIFDIIVMLGYYIRIIKQDILEVIFIPVINSYYSIYYLLEIAIMILILINIIIWIRIKEKKKYKAFLIAIIIETIILTYLCFEAREFVSYYYSIYA